MKELMIPPYYSCSLPEMFKKIEDEGLITSSVSLFIRSPDPYAGFGHYWTIERHSEEEMISFGEIFITTRRADDREEMDDNKAIDKNFGRFSTPLVTFNDKDYKKNVERCIKFIEDRAIEGAINDAMTFLGGYSEYGRFFIRSMLKYTPKNSHTQPASASKKTDREG